MALPRKLTKLEMQIMETLWSKGSASIREIQDAFPEKLRPAYTTIQTTVYRLEFKKVVRRGKKVGNAHFFEPVVSRNAAQRRLIDELLALFDGRTQPVIPLAQTPDAAGHDDRHLAETGLGHQRAQLG